MKIVRDGLGSALSAETLHEFKLDISLEKAVFEKQKIAIDEERMRTTVIAFTEIDAATVEAPITALYDKNFRVEPVDRGDPCEAFTGRIKIKT